METVQLSARVSTRWRKQPSIISMTIEMEYRFISQRIYEDAMILIYHIKFEARFLIALPGKYKQLVFQCSGGSRQRNNFRHMVGWLFLLNGFRLL